MAVFSDHDFKPKIRTPEIHELPTLSALCLRSKAVWGYDDAFLSSCRDELSFNPQDLALTYIAVAQEPGALLGVVQVKVEQSQADLLKLFVEPDAMCRGIGKALFVWAIDTAKNAGAIRIAIEADPGAAAFYRHMGAHNDGTAPSGSIPGRMLPKLALDLA